MTFNDSFVDFCNEIRKNFEARCYHREKDRFIKKLQERYPFKVDHHGTCNNLILGDIDTASLVFTAHYDTAVVSLTPNANCYFDRKRGKRMQLYAILPAFVPFVVFLLIYFFACLQAIKIHLSF